MSVPKPLVKAGVGCLVVLLIFIGGAGFMAWRILGGIVKPTTDYAAEINALVEAYQQDVAGEKNAWDDLMSLQDRSRAIFMAVGATRKGENQNVPPDVTVLRSRRSIGNQPYGLKLEEVEAAWNVLKRLESEGVFKDLDALASRKHVVRHIDVGGQMLAHAAVQDVGRIRQLSRANATRYHVAVLKGDMEEAARAFESGLGLGRFFMQQGFLVDRMVGRSLIALHTNAMLETIEKVPDEKSLRRLRTVVERQSITPPISLSLETERRYVLDVIQWSFTDLGNGNGYLLPKGLETMQLPAAKGKTPGRLYLGVMTADRKETTHVLNNYFDRLIKYAELPRQERTAVDFQPKQEVEQFSTRYRMLKLMLPHLESVINSDEMAELDIVTAKTVIGVEIWRRMSGGRPPEKLTDLIPRVMKKLPVDPISGVPLGLKFSGTRDAYGPTGKYVLYSFGGDGLDDGGLEPPVDSSTNNSRYSVLTKNPPPQGYDFIVYPIEPYD